MSERDLSNSLLQASTAEQSGPLDGRDQIAQILQRDRRRIWLLGGATLLLWLLGSCGIAFVLYALYVEVPRYLDFRYEKAGTRPIERRQSITESYLAGLNVGIVLISCSVAVLALAALGTFLLVLDTRRATLRQINASLALISERLERLQELRERERLGPASGSDSHAHSLRET
jgi:hypothetical protein